MGELAKPALKTVLAPRVMPALVVAEIVVADTPALVSVIKPALMLFKTTLAPADTPPSVRVGVKALRLEFAVL